MLDTINKIIQQQNVLSHANQGILVASVKDSDQGLLLAKQVLYEIVDSKSVLYLSGGRTPKELYSVLAKEEVLLPGAVGYVDERYGMPFHENSNQKMMQDVGLLRYLQLRDIQYIPMLQADKNREEAAEFYDQTVRELNTFYQKSVGILGIGMDGHTAGIAGNRKDFENPLFDESRKHLWVSEFDDQLGMYKERVTMTFAGLSMLDIFIVLVFGEDKKEALDLMFEDGKEIDVPSRFFKRYGIAKKTVIITDQII